MGEMKKLIFISGLFLLLYSSTLSVTHASFLSVDKEGVITANVLGYDTESLEIKSLAGLNPTAGTITLSNNQEKTELTIVSSRGERSLDVSGLNQDIIEVEEKKTPQKLTISEKDGQFIIAQGSVLASTTYTIKLNTNDNQFMLVAPSGHKFLTTLPLEAVEFLNSANIINRLSGGSSLSISEDQSGELVYIATGEKVVKPFDLFEIIIPVTANVSATSGKVTKIDGPIWYRIFGFLLV